ncbi:MAG: glucosyltransferase domain-containing protein [Saccharofermentans sp.]|nr:glucosyltransferase domain-containing protein [Saccharofermentans sp.]
MKKLLNKYVFVLAIIALISTAILSIDVPRVDDISYHKVIEEDVLDFSTFSETISAFENDDKIEFSGINYAYADVDLTKGDSLRVTVTVNNPTEELVEVRTDLWAENYDLITEEVPYVIAQGEYSFTFEFPFYREQHPDTAELRFFSNSDTAIIELKDAHVSVMNEATDGSRLVKYALILDYIGMAIAAAYILTFITYQIVKKNVKLKFDYKEALFHFSVVVTTVIGLYYIYHGINIFYPMFYASGDDVGIYYLVKSIRDYGITLINHNAGGVTGGDMFDYPYSDKLSFIIVKIISFVVTNVYAITNLFYLLTYVIVAFVTSVVCRKLSYSKPVSFLVAILYAFSPYISLRYAHMWLVPYYMLPVACYIGLRIAKAQTDVASKEALKKQYPYLMLLSFVCGFTGVYYAFFSCAVFMIGIVINFFTSGYKKLSIRFKEAFRHIIFVGLTGAGVIVNMIPNLMYWRINGTVATSELATREIDGAEKYGLKLIQMLLPRPGHRIESLAKITNEYSANYPLINENMTAALGIIASVGFIIAIIYLLCNRKEDNTESKFIISTFLVGTIGGIGSLIAVFISSTIRGYNRISLVIMFFCLLIIANLLEKLRKKIPLAAFIGVIAALVIIGLYDQTMLYGMPDYTSFDSTRRAVDYVEAQLDANDMVYVLPCQDWPSGGGYKNHMGVIESEDLIWSWGSAQGREETCWQQTIANSDAATMVTTLKAAGYDAIYFDSSLYAQFYGQEAMENTSNSITEYLGQYPYVSTDGTTYVWIIKGE